MKKIIKRKLLEDVLNTTRDFWRNPSSDDREIHEACERCGVAAEALEEDCGIGAWEIRDFLAGIFRMKGLKPDATNEEIIELLKLLGWAVTDDE